MQSYPAYPVNPCETTDLAVAQPATFFTIPWTVAGADGNYDKSLAWMEAVQAWLKTKRRKSNSQHTVDAYQSDWQQFFRFANKPPWEISGLDAEAWLQHLETQQLSHSTINRKLAALSSFYTFVSDKFTFVGPDGVERSIYIDSYGNPRTNPFKRPNRFAVDNYGHSDPIEPAVLVAARSAINQHTLTGARDFALIETYLYTGRRSSEIARLRWSDLEVDERKGKYYYAWIGKGKGGKDKPQQAELPPPAYHAILHFLRTAGRLETIRPEDYIFQPLFDDRAGRLPGVDAHNLAANRHIDPSQINRIIKRRFAAVGVDPTQVHTHTLRHTAAYLRSLVGADLLEISKFLDHSSVAITQIYLDRLQRAKPVDTRWNDIQQLILI